MYLLKSLSNNMWLEVLYALAHQFETLLEPREDTFLNLHLPEWTQRRTIDTEFKPVLHFESCSKAKQRSRKRYAVPPEEVVVVGPSRYVQMSGLLRSDMMTASEVLCVLPRQRCALGQAVQSSGMLAPNALCYNHVRL